MPDDKHKTKQDRKRALLIGDVVTLNSGGPRMLVLDIVEVDCVTVGWPSSECILERHVSQCLPS